MRLSRRRFLKIAAAANGLLLLPTGFLRGANAPSNRLHVAAIGVGGMGRGDVRGIANCKNTCIVGLCDVDSTRLEAALDDYKERFPEVRGFADFREMLATLGDSVDAVAVSTPDHTHFDAAFAAAQLGKHLYVQKPLCRTVSQVRRLATLVREKKLVAQMGNQGASSAHTRSAREFVEAGLLGEVREVISWTDRPNGGGWRQGMPAFAPAAPAPASLDWNRWLGPAPQRPYSPEIHPFKWRGFLDYGVGALGDMGTHLLFDAYLALGLDAPERIEAETHGGTNIAFPQTSKVTFHFPAKNGRPAVKYVWFDGDHQPAEIKGWLTTANGNLLLGDKHRLFVSGWANTFAAYDARGNTLSLKVPPRKYPRVKGSHYQNWIDAIQKSTPLSSPFEIAAPFCEAILAGVITQRLAHKNLSLIWDTKNAQFQNAPEANALL
jgi:predicted dehydrogenase